MVKKTSSGHVTRSSHSHESGGWSMSQNLFKESPPLCLIPERNHKKVLEVISEITGLLSIKVPIRCQDVAVYFSMEEKEYMEQHEELYKDVMVESQRTCYYTKRKFILNDIIPSFCLKINYLLTGEEYSIVQKTSEDPGTLSIQRSTMNPPPQCLISERHKDWNILKAISQINEIVTGEVPIGCQDVAVYFSMEEWEYMKRHKELYKDFMMEDHHRPKSPGGQHLDQFRGEAKENPAISSTMETEDEESSNFSEEDTKTPNLHLKFYHKDLKIITMDNHHHGGGEVSPLVDHGRADAIFSPVGHGGGGGMFPLIDHSRANGTFPLADKGAEMLPLVDQGGDNETLFAQKAAPILSWKSHPEKSPLTCSHCGKRFPYKSALFRHEKIHTKVKTYACPMCGKGFSDEVTLGKHLVIHGVQNPCSCMVCGRHFTLKADLDKHLKVHTESNQWSCSHCGKLFPFKSELLRHEKVHTRVKTYTCSKCGKCYSSLSSLYMHESVHIREFPLACLVCGKRFLYQATLTIHERIHTGEKPYSCSDCDKRFSDKSNLMSHRRVHTREKPYSCPQCGKCFAHKSGLTLHEKFHLGEMHRCLVCGTCFSQKSDFIIHKQSHEQDTPVTLPEGEKCSKNVSTRTRIKKIKTQALSHVCSECGKRFSTKTTLEIHSRIHTGERPFACSLCEKSFSYSSALFRHKKIHAGDKPHACSVCGKCFTHKNALINHGRIHTGEKPYTCSECDKKFSQQSSLVKHLEGVHRREKPYSCSECGKGFSQKARLLAHNRHHLVDSHVSAPNLENRLPLK